MLRKSFCWLLAISWLLIACTGALWATVTAGEEVPVGKWWRMPQAAEKLKLTEEEKQRLDDIFLESRRKLIDCRSDLEKARLELENLLTREPLDEPGTKEEFKKLEDARSRLAGERFNFLLEVRKILGVERFRQLETAFKEYRQKNPQGQGGANYHDSNKGDASRGGN